MTILSVILQSKQTQNGKKVLLPVTEKQNENVMVPVYCRGWGKSPQQIPGKLNKQNEIDLLVYKTQWFLEHWLMMSECLGSPKPMNWNVTLICLLAWAIYGIFPLHDKGGKTQPSKAVWSFHYLVASQSLLKLYFKHVGSNNDLIFSNPDFSLWSTQLPKTRDEMAGGFVHVSVWIKPRFQFALFWGY